MENINIIRENANKHLSIDNLNTDNTLSNTINIKRPVKQYDPFHDEPTLSEASSEMGVEYIANDNKKVESERSYGGDQPDDVFMNPQYAHDNYDDARSSAGFSQSSSIAKLTKKEIRTRKAAALVKLERLAKQGYAPKNMFGAEHSLEELEAEADRCQQMKDIQGGVQMGKYALMTMVAGIEKANETFNPQQHFVNLNGWSNSVNMSIDNYDSVIEELYLKYSGPMQAWGPEFKLISMLGMSAVGYSISQQNSIKNLRNMRKRMYTEEEDELINEMEGEGSISDVSSMYSEETSSSQFSDKVIPLEPINYQMEEAPVKKKRGRPRKNK